MSFLLIRRNSRCRTIFGSSSSGGCTWFCRCSYCWRCFCFNTCCSCRHRCRRRGFLLSTKRRSLCTINTRGGTAGNSRSGTSRNRRSSTSGNSRSGTSRNRRSSTTRSSRSGTTRILYTLYTLDTNSGSNTQISCFKYTHLIC
ncbi:hypothetical protein RirG_223630 [Rhizophagus irregularis DAOM 197198w]|uniref:Uncharacterized protein n=1 Tax=Rhizophagus irregularis (strain DAOM 197198w) TaxID=1432141 RepID=A0A015JL27_RHIIW|nr:hypothetical protein RirG_223630 [Rhizophagus irregularis DAOM 197198w]